MKIKYGVIGYGWRADIYTKIAQLASDKFEITARVLRTNERAKEVSLKEGIFATSSLQEALLTSPDFWVLCVPKAIAEEYLIHLMQCNVPVLCETPPALGVDHLNGLWSEYMNLNGRVQVAEQYFLQPYYASVLEIIKQRYLGEISSAMISAVHGYHAMSIFRKILGVEFGNCSISGKRFASEVVQTCGRAGFDTSGEVKTTTRDWVSLAFENQKVALMDFTGEQYFSSIRKRSWNIRGHKGEIQNDDVCYLNRNNIPVEQEMKRMDIGINNISKWSHKGIMFLDNYIYENPYYPSRMNDDEIAVATCLEKMKRYVETGEEFYPLREALQDAYLALQVEEAIATGETIKTEDQSWVSC